MISIEIENISKSFGKKRVLNNINLRFSPGSIISVLGPNASGKTTLIKTILGMVYPDKGVVKLDGQAVYRTSEYKRQINYLPQIAQFPENMKVFELVKLIEDIRGKDHRAEELIEIFGLKSFLSEKVNILSGGTKQKVNAVIAFMYDNPVYILDEPTNGLDPLALIRLKSLIMKERANGKCIVITTHIMELVEELSDVIIYMLEGHIHFNGTVSELKTAYSQPSVEACLARMLEGDKAANRQSGVSA